MKRKYVSPSAEKLDFDFSENVTASSGHKYRKYTDNYFGCKEVATDEWFDDIP